VRGSGINWAIWKSAPRSRQITTPAPHHSVFYSLDALLAARPTASKHWRHYNSIINNMQIVLSDKQCWWLLLAAIVTAWMNATCLLPSAAASLPALVLFHCFTQATFISPFLLSRFVIPAKASLRGDYVITGIRLSVCPAVCLSVTTITK